MNEDIYNYELCIVFDAKRVEYLKKEEKINLKIQSIYKGIRLVLGPVRSCIAVLVKVIKHKLGSLN